MCSAADAREIVVSAATRAALTTSAFELEALPPLCAKGKDAPLDVYRVAWARAAGSNPSTPASGGS